LPDKPADIYMLKELQIPASYINRLLELTQRKGIATDELLAGIRFYESIRQDHLDLNTTAQIVYRALERYGPSLGYDVGLSTTLTNHGLLAFGAMALPNGHAVLKFADRYLSLQIQYLSFKYQVVDQEIQMEFQEAVDLGSLRQYVFDSFLVGLSRTLMSLWADNINNANQLTLCFDYPQPPHFATYQHALPPCRFNTYFNGVVFPTEWLDKPFTTADTTTAKLIESQCEINLPLTRPKSQQSMADRVKKVLESSPDGFPTLPEIAKHMHVSERTLKRKLAAENFQYRQLLDLVRARKAKKLLSKTSLSVGDIALQMGYSSASAFTAAFQQWTGLSPSLYRKQASSN